MKRATKKDVRRWIRTAKVNGATHIISVCDTFDYEDYPVYVSAQEDVDEVKKKYDGVNMQSINEIICMAELATRHLTDTTITLEWKTPQSLGIDKRTTIPPKGGWKNRTHYVVEASFSPTNPIHKYIFRTEHMHGTSLVGHFAFITSYLSDCYFLKAIREIEV